MFFYARNGKEIAGASIRTNFGCQNWLTEYERIIGIRMKKFIAGAEVTDLMVCKRK